uniref:Targeting protein for Xklp2 n=1 Tax=Timema bartmani TaxID=61472 RepID=A0A7R9EZ96_9NEOP|nr:unnamed protein product [Timema bartmani]
MFGFGVDCGVGFLHEGSFPDPRIWHGVVIGSRSCTNHEDVINKSHPAEWLQGFGDHDPPIIMLPQSTSELRLGFGTDISFDFASKLRHEILDSVKINENNLKKKNSTPLKHDGPNITHNSGKEHQMLTRLDKAKTPSYSLRSRSVERSIASAGKVMNTNSSKKNVIQKTTQPRSSQPKINSQKTIQPTQELTPYKPWVFKPTIPVTPGLTSHLRTRPVHYPTQEQKEEAAFMEMKTHQVKAYPLNMDIFKQPKLGIRVEAKQHTIPEPFNLTEIKKKEVLQSPQFAFKARPISKGILENAKGIPEKKPLPATKPVTPNLIIKRRIPLKVFEDTVEVIDGKTVMKPKEVFNFGVPQVFNKRNTPSKRMTEVKPFSFEKRDIELQKKKDEKIKAVFEEEKKARIFHANPVPQLCRDVNKGLFTDVSITTDKSQDENMNTTFRARPAKVLNQEPFVPKPADRRPLIPVDLVLNTENRAKVREEFNQYLKERDDHIEQLRAEERAKQEEREKREAEEMKQVAESFKARPIPKYKVLNVRASSVPLTKPCSPRFSVLSHNKSDN